MNEGIKQTDFQFDNLVSKYTGKVRDVYEFEDKLAMIATDRISAFDAVLPRAIPYKGQVLNQTAAHFLNATKEIVPNWLESTPDPSVSIGKKCTPFKVEMVIRGYLAGHAWREYRDGNRRLCGNALPEGLNENDRLPSPIITPTTKADQGHDEDISREQILRQGIVSENHYKKLEDYTFALFDKGTEMARERGLILVDTKYEFGLYNDEIYLIDEIHTPDSSRYFYQDTYEKLQNESLPQRQLSKEFVRQWLIENGFQGKEGQVIPEMSDEFVTSVSERYIELYEKITGITFEKTPLANRLTVIEESIRNNI